MGFFLACHRMHCYLSTEIFEAILITDCVIMGLPRRRWEDNINMDLQEVGCRGVNWIELAHDRDRWRALVNAVMKLRVP